MQSQIKRLSIHNQHLWDSSSDDDDDDDNNNNPILITRTINQQQQQSQVIINNNTNVNRLSLLPAFPSLHQHGVVVYRGREHLLLANIPRMLLRTFYAYVLFFLFC